MDSSDRTISIAFLASAVLAGGNAVAIRFSNREVPPLWGAGLRFALAAILLIGLTAVLKVALPRGRAFVGAVIWGLFQFTGAFGLAYFALVEVHAGLGQILLALVPLVTLLLAVAQRLEQLRLRAVVGTILGVSGIALISSDPLRESVPLLSLLAVLGSVVCFAQAAVLVRRFPPVHPVAMNAIGMIAGSAVLVLSSALVGERFVIPERSETLLALGYVVVVGSVGVFLLYVFVLNHWDASRAAYSFLLIPFFTVALSVWLDDEPIRLTLITGGLLVLIGVYIGALRGALRRRESPSPAARA